MRVIYGLSYALYREGLFIKFLTGRDACETRGNWSVFRKLLA